jgi:hypothetical protein
VTLGNESIPMRLDFTQSLMSKIFHFPFYLSLSFDRRCQLTSHGVHAPCCSQYIPLLSRDSLLGIDSPGPPSRMDSHSI